MTNRGQPKYALFIGHFHMRAAGFGRPLFYHHSSTDLCMTLATSLGLNPDWHNLAKACIKIRLWPQKQIFKEIKMLNFPIRLIQRIRHLQRAQAGTAYTETILITKYRGVSQFLLWSWAYMPKSGSPSTQNSQTKSSSEDQCLTSKVEEVILLLPIAWGDSNPHLSPPKTVPFPPGYKIILMEEPCIPLVQESWGQKKSKEEVWLCSSMVRGNQLKRRSPEWLNVRNLGLR